MAVWECLPRSSGMLEYMAAQMPVACNEQVNAPTMKLVALEIRGFINTGEV